MKKINHELIMGIIWVVLACVFFCNDKIWVALPWLFVGIIKLDQGIHANQTSKKSQDISSVLTETVNTQDEEKDYIRHTAVIETIELLKEVHTIYDEYSDYGYVVDKVFKPAKSHAAEVELLCTYAPDDEYGEEGAIPYIAVQTGDEVYCAIEEYKESKTFDGVISIEPLDGLFMFRAKRDYYGDIMYFYGFELEGEGYWEGAGLCLVYPKEYVGTENEAKLMNVLDEAAKSFKKNCK